MTLLKGSELLSSACGGREVGELIIPDTLKVGIAPYDNHEIAKQWARERGMKEGDIVQGAIIVSDEVARAKGKIREN
jgi:hypothetical protein